jgi:glycosyltransferase involved in cell wall biosynthesis
MTYAVVIPLYNEAERMQKTINQIFDFFRPYGETVKLIFVNDGSTDATVQVLSTYQQTFPFQLVSYSTNRGKGHAIRRGAQEASADWIVFFDIDLATPLSEFTNLTNTLSPADHIVIGSRRLESSKIEKYESGLRTFLGHGFTKLSNLLVPGVTDFTCGFKCFSNKAAQDIFAVARIDRWGFDTELLYIAKLRGWQIREVPVVWTHDNDSRVRVGMAVASSMRELLQMKYNALRGLYSRKQT